MSGGKYVRVYYDLGCEYPDVWADAGLLGTWLQLLMLAEQTWPNTPPYPMSAKRSAVKKLLDCGLVIDRPHGFTILGLDAERTRRSKHAKHAASIRWEEKEDAPSNAQSNAQSMLSTRTRTSTRTREGKQGLRPLENGRAQALVNPAGGTS